MHPEQVKSIKLIFSFLIDEVIVNDRSLSERVEDKFPILVEKLKPNKAVSSPIDVQTATVAFYDAVLIFYLSKNLLPPFLKNERELSEDTKNNLIDFLFSYFSSLPHKYNIEIPLQYLDIPDFKEVDGKLEVSTQGAGVHHQSPPLTTIKKKYLKLSGQGYFSRDNSSHEIKPYLQDFNVFLYEMITSKILITRKTPSLRGYQFNDRIEEGVKSIPILKAKIINKSHSQYNVDYELPLQLSKFLDELTVASDSENHSMERLIFTNKLINDNSEAAKYIKAAMDWYMNAQMVMDETMSFIQICMGLEALLGDKREGSIGLTQTLSDRCSYLIGKGMSDREEIKKQLKKAYELRSAIVHGLKNRINESEKEYVKNATLFLRRAIKVECQFLNY